MPVRRSAPTRPFRTLWTLVAAALLAGCGGAATPIATRAPAPAVESTAATPATAIAATATSAPAPAAPTTAAPASPTAAAAAPPTPPPTAVPAGPRTVASGRFARKNYNGGGRVEIVALPDGSTVARFGDDFTVDKGPKLLVYLTTEASPGNRAEVERGFVDLGPLKEVKGAQEYAIPAGTDLTAYAGVIVYCAEFHVTFIAAPLAKQ